MFYTTTYMSPMGEITLASDGTGLTGLWLPEQKYFGGTVDSLSETAELPVFRKTENWLDRYFAGEKPDISELPLAPAGSEFRQAVWKILCQIPYGEVTTYGEIAREISAQRGKRMAAQAVGGAVGHNPISIIIPCHRVVGSNGNLTGYGGGIDKKIWLLEHEKVDMTGMFVPKKGTAL